SSQPPRLALLQASPTPSQVTSSLPDPEGLRHAIAFQGNLLNRQADALTQMSSAQQELFRRLDGITQSLMELTGQNTDLASGAATSVSGNNATSASQVTPENVRLQPEPFFGDVSACGGFLLQCDLIFQQAPRYYQADHARISLIVNSLRSKALQWAQAFLAAHPITHLPFDRFLGEFRLVFDQPRKQEEATRRLLSLKQGNRPVSEHLIDFRILAVEVGWPDPALKGIFHQSLNERIKDHLCTQPETDTFEELVTAALRSDLRLRERLTEQKSKPSPTLVNPVRHVPLVAPASPVSPSVKLEVPMQIANHVPKFLYVPVKLCIQSKILETNALIDSGAEHSLIDQSLVHELSLPVEELDFAVKAAGLGGKQLSRITKRTGPVLVFTSGNHREYHHFFITQCPQTPLIFGFSWLQKHNPCLDWGASRVTNWSTFCMANCLQSAVPHTKIPDPGSSKEVDLSNIPTCYHDLRSVFCKSRASALPPHRPYDCAIELLNGAPLPKSKLYNLSGPEKSSMEAYIQEALSLGHIRPSSSPVAAGFFFVEKKDKTLRPCIDFRELNQITVKDKYSLPLLESVFNSVQQAKVFTKLDLRNAYHLVRMREGDEWKTAFNTPLGHFEYLVMPFGLTNAPAVFQRLVNDVLRDFLNRFVFVYLDDILVFSADETQHEHHVRLVLERLLANQLFVKAEKCAFHVSSVPFLGYIIEAGNIRPDPAKIEAVVQWETPHSRKKLQQFLGFSNFYRRFIRDYSTIAAPLTRLTSTNRPFVWDSAADAAFKRLKTLFVSAPILIQPDVTKQFIVEVDASDSGVGAVLSQREDSSGKLKPCAFFSRKLNPTGQNYDVGNRELLAIKLALEEWRHWLEGAEQQFIIWTDHKNLAYLRSARRLNSRQARWCLFFDRFNFVISYRPGSRNVKPDALSRIHSITERSTDSTILPTSCFIGNLTWEIETKVQSDVLAWGHTSRIACHGGTYRTIRLIKRRFFWPSLERDVKEYIAACTTCARSKTSNRPPSGLLQPLPVPSRPWSHIAVDFINGLPPSQGHSVILTVIDRFSKAAQFIPLPQLPSASETADVLVNHVFRHHGIPSDIVSDRGPQFTSQVWKAFCSALGATVSLTSGYHPQANGQAERANQELEAALRCLASQNQADWSKYLVWAEYAHNNHSSTATGKSPFEPMQSFVNPQGGAVIIGAQMFTVPRALKCIFLFVDPRSHPLSPLTAWKMRQREI
uniref:Gypsy retrotransposon integrase-like protein 1 n=1 Tax=Oryzias latipes TaxID=8090 RepID=A0A3P9IMG0_ORYLA